MNEKTYPAFVLLDKHNSFIPMRMTMKEIHERLHGTSQNAYQYAMQSHPDTRPDHIVYFSCQQHHDGSRAFYFYNDPLTYTDEEFDRIAMNTTILYVGALHKGTAY